MGTKGRLLRLDGNEILVEVAAKTSKKLWYGGTVKGLPLGGDSKYTITFKIKSDNVGEFSSGNNGLYFHVDANESTIANSDGFYGNLSKDSGPFLSLMKSGSKATGDTHSNGKDYIKTAEKLGMTPVIDADGFADVAIEVDGFKYTVYLDGGKTRFDAAEVDEASKKVADSFGIMFYTYSSGGAVKDVKIYNGNTISNPPAVTTAAVAKKRKYVLVL